MSTLARAAAGVPPVGVDPFPSVGFRDLNTFDRLTIPVPVKCSHFASVDDHCFADQYFTVPGHLVADALSSLASRGVMRDPDPSWGGGGGCC